MKQQLIPALTEASIPGFSILICCYNSAKRLPQTIAALARMPAADYAVEVLVVDNASKDDTSAVAESLLGAPNFPHAGRVLYQAVPGKSHALELGLREARYKYIVIVDDDNWLAPNYLNLAWALMEADPIIGVLGGMGEPVCEGIPPTWFSQFAVDYAAAPQATCSGDVTRTNCYLYGAGMVLRKAAWDDVLDKGFASLVTEVDGSKPSGEDNEMCYALILAGYKIWYDSEMRFLHFISAGRLTWNYLQLTYQANAVSEIELLPWTHYLKRGLSGPDSKIKPLFWLRNGAYMLKYMSNFLIKSLQTYDLGREGSADSIRVTYYWNAFKQCVKKEVNRDTSFFKIENFIKKAHEYSIRNKYNDFDTYN